MMFHSLRVIRFMQGKFKPDTGVDDDVDRQHAMVNEKFSTNYPLI